MTNKIFVSDVYAGLHHLEDGSVDVAITSPPYWAQRNYGFDKQIGNEETYMEFISKLTYIFDVLKNKLSPEGVFFLNIGDKYLKKYGKTPLGLIPYKLAYFMQQNGWVLNDIIIWHKPNHMPSSVKNRFVNSYEPVFVFSRSPENYFTAFVKNHPGYTNVIDVNLQPTPFKHVAVYPEKLVDTLLDFVKINKDYTVLDPFAGSGTTLKVVVDRNRDIFRAYKARGIMIEYNPEYVEIIRKRVPDVAIEVKVLKEIPYRFPLLKEPILESLECYKQAGEGIPLKSVNIFKEKERFCRALKTLSSPEFVRSFPKDEILFIGSKQYDLESIYAVSLIKNWVLRNKLVVREKKWYPVFMLVHDNKSHRYKFNYKALQINHKDKKPPVYHHKDFSGNKVADHTGKHKRKGILKKILSRHPNGLPEYVEVLWDDGAVTKEYVIDDREALKDNLIFFQANGYVSVKEKRKIADSDKVLALQSEAVNAERISRNKKTYNGKFKTLERKNWGASPGARSSVEEEYFSMQRLYPVKQELIADYLNYLRLNAGLSKKAFADLFPPSYKHTVGHWLRKDFGGSVPVKEDWELLERHFDIDPGIKNYALLTGLKLQAVGKTKYKIPDDVISPELIDKLDLLNREE